MVWELICNTNVIAIIESNHYDTISCSDIFFQSTLNNTGILNGRFEKAQLRTKPSNYVVNVKCYIVIAV